MHVRDGCDWSLPKAACRHGTVDKELRMIGFPNYRIGFACVVIHEAFECFGFHGAGQLVFRETFEIRNDDPIRLAIPLVIDEPEARVS